MNIAVEYSNKQNQFDGDILRFLPGCLGKKKHKAASAAAKIKSFEFHFWKQVDFELGYQDKI